MMCGSSDADEADEVSSVDQPCLTVRFLNSEVSSECQAMPGTRASTRQSMAAVTNWMPPP